MIDAGLDDLMCRTDAHADDDSSKEARALDQLELAERVVEEIELAFPASLPTAPRNLELDLASLSAA